MQVRVAFLHDNLEISLIEKEKKITQNPLRPSVVELQVTLEKS